MKTEELDLILEHIVPILKNKIDFKKKKNLSPKNKEKETEECIKLDSYPE